MDEIMHEGRLAHPSLADNIHVRDAIGIVQIHGPGCSLVCIVVLRAYRPILASTPREAVL